MNSKIVNRSTNIIINTSFSAVHCWSKCPIKEVNYLKNPHRHTFYLRLKFPVSHEDRDIEFINMKNDITAYIHDFWEGKDIGQESCEMICKTFIVFFNASYVRVMEDNENGAEMFEEEIKI